MSLTGKQQTLLEKMFGPQFGDSAPTTAPKTAQPGYLTTVLNNARNQNNINQLRGTAQANSTATGIPKHVFNVKAQIAPASASMTSAVTVTFAQDPSDKNFSGVLVFAKGYQGNPNPVQIANGSSSPVQFIVSNTGESLSLSVQAVGNSGRAAISSAPIVGVKLPQSTLGGFSKSAVTSVALKGVNTNHQLGTTGTAPVNASGVSTAIGAVLSQSGTSTTINVASFTIQYGFGQVTYSSGSVNPGSYGKFTIYFSDPAYAGGAVTFLATSAAFNSFSADGLQGIGSITTVSGGGGTGGGGGGGGGVCFSPNTRIRLQDGEITIGELPIGAEVLTAATTWKSVKAKVTGQYKGTMFDIGGGELVTPNHAFLINGQWTPARDLGFPKVEYDGPVMNLVIGADTCKVSDIMSANTEHSYTLANGYTVHNFLPS